MGKLCVRNNSAWRHVHPVSKKPSLVYKHYNFYFPLINLFTKDTSLYIKRFGFCGGYISSVMAVLYAGDSLFKYLRINRSGSCVRSTSGARVEALRKELHDIEAYQVRGSYIFQKLRGKCHFYQYVIVKCCKRFS